MKGQTSIELILLLSLALIMVVILFSYLFIHTASLTQGIVNETENYYVLTQSFSVNNSGIIIGKIEMSKYLPIQNMELQFQINSQNYMIPFSANVYNTSYGAMVLLKETSNTPYSSFLNQNYNLKTAFFSVSTEKEFTYINETGVFS